MAINRYFFFVFAGLLLAGLQARAGGLDVGSDVDDFFRARELESPREPATDPSDRCLARGAPTFAAVLEAAVSRQFNLRRVDLSYLSQPGFDPYHLRGNSRPAAVSLASHPFCPVERASLEQILSTAHSPAKMPGSRTVKALVEFSNLYNGLRLPALTGDPEARRKLGDLWMRFMGCLAYVESLRDADRRESDRLAKAYAPSGYRRPSGVNFYFDRGQPPESALNIGLFQFAPGSGGNIQSCLREWNKDFPACPIALRAPPGEMIRILGSSRQAFNAYCGLIQVLNTFYTQVNTGSAYGTHPANVEPGGALKSSEERCVSLQVRSGRAYNHFGPFHNSTGSNLAELMACVLPAGVE